MIPADNWCKEVQIEDEEISWGNRNSFSYFNVNVLLHFGLNVRHHARMTICGQWRS